MGLLPNGSPAPQFSLPATPDQRVALSEFRGKNVVLVFYPADWSPVCSDELVIFNNALPMLKEYNAQLLAISVDGAWCHQAFRQNRGLHFPLLSDFEPKGETARKYRAYRDHEGISERALYVIDTEGVIRWSELSPVGVSPGADGILDALESLAHEQAAHGG